MKINHKIIKKLKPCEDRYENFKKYYPDFDSDLKEFLYLDKISYADKAWVFVKLATKEQIIKWNTMCTESILDIFETKYPNDLRPRNALEASEAYRLSPTEINRKVAATAANDCLNLADTLLNARVENNAAHAAYAAAFTAFRSSYSISHQGINANTDTEKQQELNLMFMLEAIS